MDCTALWGCIRHFCFFTPAGGTVNQFFFPKKYDQSSELITPNSWMGEASCSERGPHLLSLYQFQVHCTLTDPNLHENVALAPCPSPSRLLLHGITLALQLGHCSGMEKSLPPTEERLHGSPWIRFHQPSSLCKWHPAPWCSPKVLNP